MAIEIQSLADRLEQRAVGCYLQTVRISILETEVSRLRKVLEDVVDYGDPYDDAVQLARQALKTGPIPE